MLKIIFYLYENGDLLISLVSAVNLGCPGIRTCEFFSYMLSTEKMG